VLGSIALIAALAGMGAVGAAAATGCGTGTPAKRLNLRISDFPRGASLLEASSDGGMTKSGVRGTSYKVRVLYPLGAGQAVVTSLVGVTDCVAQAQRLFAPFRDDSSVKADTVSKLRLARLGDEQVALWVRESNGEASAMLVVRSQNVVWMLGMVGRPELTRHRAIAELSKYGAKIASRVKTR
jgi:hypothetical protein